MKISNSTTALIDFGSTYTKVALVDLENEELIAKQQALSTVNENIMDGLNNALRKFSLKEQKILETASKLACSSAAGGLRVIAIGLVPELTVEAARRAALGAGAKIVASYGHELNNKDLKEIVKHNCDLILLSGGVDGGNKEVILRNAEALAGLNIEVPFVVAGNRTVSEKAANILRSSGFHAGVADNILPTLDVINVEPARELIRKTFMARIVKAKGLDKAQQYVGDIIMPTPMATLKAGQLLAQGVDEEPGLGELMIVEVGGATTNVHSVANGLPSDNDLTVKGLPEPFAKRTVEGDLGIRYNATTILERSGVTKIRHSMSIACSKINNFDINNKIEMLSHNIGYVPVSVEDYALDSALACCAVNIAVERHSGHIKAIPTPKGTVNCLFGKDLTELPIIIGAGGIFVYGKSQKTILDAALYDSENRTSLKPIKPAQYIDSSYLLYGIGLLSQIQKGKALRIAKKYLKKL